MMAPHWRQGVDPGLVIRAQGGDESAFAELVERSIGRLNAVARLILGHNGSAEDAVQDALVDAWRDLPRLRDPQRFEAWLRRLLVRACFDRARRTRRTSVREIRADVEFDGPTSAAPDLALRDEVERALRTLSAEHRAALVLTYYVDLSLADAAAALDIPIGTMKSRLDRARESLRAALEAQDRVSIGGTEQLA